MDLSIQYFVRIILIWLLCLLSVLLHESGHALGYRISGGKAGWKVVVGSGPRLISISRFTFGLIPAGGNFVPAEEPETDKGQIIMPIERVQRLLGHEKSTLRCIMPWSSKTT